MTLQPIAEPAIKALINFCDDSAAMQQMLSARLVDAIMESMQDAEFPFKRLCIMLLSNLCQTMEGCIQLLQRESLTGAGTSTLGLHFRRLLQWFLTPPDTLQNTADDPFEFCASIIHNCTQLVEARKIILEPERGILAALLPQLESPSAVRRRGTAGALRNCCFELEQVDWLLSPAIDIVAKLCTPLIGPTPYKAAESAHFPDVWVTPAARATHEPDAATRVLLLESLLLLAAHRSVRDLMRTWNVYTVIRNLHYWIEGIEVLGDGALKGPPSGEGAAASSAAARASAAARSTAEAHKVQGGAEARGDDAVGSSASRGGVQHMPDDAAEEKAAVAAARSGGGRAEDTQDLSSGVVELSPLDEKAGDVVNQLVQYLHRDESRPVAAEALPSDGETAVGVAAPCSTADVDLDLLRSAKPADGRVEGLMERHVHEVAEPSIVPQAAASRDAAATADAAHAAAAGPAVAATAGNAPQAKAGDLVDAAGFGGMD
jgi:hypothetical protein